jgi:hypothetical protein
VNQRGEARVRPLNSQFISAADTKGDSLNSLLHHITKALYFQALRFARLGGLRCRKARRHATDGAMKSHPTLFGRRFFATLFLTTKEIAKSPKSLTCPM